MSQSQRGHGELSLSQNSKEAESESKKEASFRKVSILSKELNTSWGVIRVPYPRGRCELRGHMFSSVQFSHSVLSDSLHTQGLQHARLLCTSPTPRVDSNSPSHPLSSPSPSAFNLSQHQGLFKWVTFSHQVAKVLEFQLQHQSFQWIFRTDLL